MATIAARSDETVLKINKFLGLNENPDGDTTLKNGELSRMKNFRITQDGHMQIRPGTKTVLSLAEAWEGAGGESTFGVSSARVCGVWRGFVDEVEHTVAAYGGGVWDLDVEGDETSAVCIGTCTQDDTTFFGFDGKLYLLNGHEYKVWDGNTSHAFSPVVGYIPIVQTATTPGGAGTLLENVNRLTAKRRVQFSPDGTETVFHLPEKGIASVDKVIHVVTEMTSGWSANITDGTVTFTEAPTAGTNTIEITYTASASLRADVEHMRFSEFYNGVSDTRVFLYGDGTNRTIYSGIDGDTGKASAEYFPDLYEISVGESNTPITSLVRHYSKLMAYKSNSAWTIQYSMMTLADGTTTSAFYCHSVNRQIGNDAPGQVKLLENNPVTLDGEKVYHWKSGSSYGASIVNSETNAKRISDRVNRSLARMPYAELRTFNIKQYSEFWFLHGGMALIMNYANNTWYVYEQLPFDYIIEANNELYGFGLNGGVFHFSRRYRSDDGEPIDCYAETGAMDFGRDWLQKFSAMIFVAIQPETNARVHVTVETNRRSDYSDGIVAANQATFTHVDFNHFSFSTNRKPQVRRVRMKVKKATFYKLIFKSNSASATATIIETDISLRYAGKVK